MFSSELIQLALDWYGSISTKEIQMPYGQGRDKTEISLRIPLQTMILDHPISQIISNEFAVNAVNSALDNPTSGKTIADLVTENYKPPREQKATVIVCDKTRPVPYRCDDPRGILAPILQRLVNAKIVPNNINILVALGTHSESNLEKWTRDAFGAEIVEAGYNFLCHDCNASDLVSLGEISTGGGESIEVKLNKILTESDIIIPTGFIEPHFTAGVSAGCKLFIPGCASEESILGGIHKPSIMADPNSDYFNVDHNPLLNIFKNTVDELIQQHNSKIFNVNVTMYGNNLTGIFTGNINSSHKAGIKLLETYAKSYIDKSVDIVISPAGHVASSSQYQAVKLLFAASRIIKKDGYALIVSSMAENKIGGDGYISSMKLLKDKGPEKYLFDILKKDYHYKREEWQTIMCARALTDGKKVAWLTSNKHPNLSQENFNQLPGISNYDVAMPNDNKIGIGEIVTRMLAVICYQIVQQGRNPRVAYVAQETVVPTLL
jgi:nickel-dependent lactate racemase